MPTPTVRDHGLVTGLHIITSPGRPVECSAFVGPNTFVKTEIDTIATALGHATRSGREVEVEYVAPDVINRLEFLPTPLTQPLPPLPGDNGGEVTQLALQDAGGTTYSTATIEYSPNHRIEVETAIPMIEAALAVAARNGIRVEIDYVTGARNTLTNIRLLDR